MKQAYRLISLLPPLLLSLFLNTAIAGDNFKSTDFNFQLPTGMKLLGDKDISLNKSDTSHLYMFLNKPYQQAVSVMVMNIPEDVRSYQDAEREAITGAVEGLRLRAKMPIRADERRLITRTLTTEQIGSNRFKLYSLNLPHGQARVLSTVNNQKLYIITTVSQRSGVSGLKDVQKLTQQLRYFEPTA